MNLTERAEIRRETFYKLTNSAVAPEVPGGSRNLLRNSKSFTGSNITGSSKLLNENYNGYAVRYLKATEWAEIAQFSNCTVPKVNSVYTASFWAKGSGKIRAYFYGNPHYLEVLDGSSNQNARTTAPDGAIDFTVTSEWKRYWVTYTLKSSFPSSDTTVAKHFLLRHLKSTSEEEFWVAGCKLEERNIADSCGQAPEDFGWTMDTITPTQSNRYLWKFDYIYYSDDSVEITAPVNLSLAGREEVYRETFYKLSEEGALGNLVIESKLSKGWLNGNGNGQILGPSANAECTTDFIQVVAGRSYTFQWWATITEGQKCWEAWQFYDKNKTPFGNRGGYGEYGSDGAQHGKRAITAPENAYYIRLSFRSFGNGHMMFEAGAGSESFEPSFDDSLKQGDRNLLAKTNQGKTNWAWSISSGGAVAGDEYIDGVNAVKLTRTSDDAASWSYVQYQGLMRKLLEPNTEYTLSFDIYPSQNVTFTASLMRGDATGLLTNVVRMNQALANKWTKVSCVLTTKETLSDLTTQVVYLLGMPSAKGNYLIIKNIKLKKGVAPSNYTPAPEDYNWSNVSLTPTTEQRYLWKFEYIYYSDGSASATDLVNLSIAGREETHRDVTFWHGLSASKHPLGIYDCGNRDHAFANIFTVVSGKKYTVKVIAQRQKGTINLKGGIWYTERTSGYQFDGLAALTQVGELTEDGLGIWERTLTVPDGKTKGQVYVQLEQSSSTGYTTAYRIYDAQVFDENGTPLVTDQNTFGGLTTPMAAPYGTYIWKRTIRHFSDGATTTDWEYSGIGGKGADGIAGKDGVGVKSHLVTYGLSASETTQPTSWSTQVPTLTKGNYLWTKTTWTYTDNTTETGYQKTYIAKDGNNGKDGIAGKDGVGIKTTAFFYVASTSGTTKPTTGWSTTIPNVPPGNYLWVKTVWTYTDNTSESGYSVAKMGESQYTHFAYCNITTLCNESASFTLQAKSTVRYGCNDKWIYKTLEAGTYTASNSFFGRDPASKQTKHCELISDFSLTDSTGRNWLGMYSDNLSDAVANPSYFTWQLTRGATGATGPQGPKGEQGIAGATGATGAQGPKGADGKTSYIHIKYSSVANPTDSQITDTPNAYIGVYTDYNSADSTKASSYKWSKWQGKDGAQGIQGPKGADGKTTYVHFAYANSADGKTNFNTNYFSGALYVGILTDYNSADSTNYAAYTWSRLKGETGPQGPIGPQGIQGIQGPKGDQGIQGPKGADGKTSYTHIAYADNDSGGGFSQTDQTKAYIGMYVDFTATDSTDVTKYKWSKWHGDKGATGPQGIQGPKGADGRTPYLHIAYANSADGRTGFTTTNTNNKRYLGTYTDYTQADSTDPTKYKWVDMVGTVEVGGVNLLHNSKGPFQPNKTDPYKHDNYIVYPKVTAYLEEGKQYIVSAKTDGAFSNIHVNVESDNIILWMVKQGGSVNQIISDTKTAEAGTPFIWNHPTGEYCLRVNAYHDDPDKSAWDVKIEEGNIKTTYTRNPDDVQSEIDSKADQAITQQQLEALEAKRQQMIVEIEAKATLEQLSELTTFLNNLKKEDTDGRQKIIELTNAIEERVKSIEPIMDYSQKMQFIDTYITQGNGGMVIGANDSTTKVVVTPSRISFQDGGSEVAYISQSVLHIDNGVFTMSLQLGHFITRAHPKNQYVNATYFVK